MNRRALVLASLAALPVSALSSPVAAKPGSAARRRRSGGLTASHVRSRTVTRTFSNTTPMLIPAGAPGVTLGPASVYPSAIQVSGLNRGRIVKVRVSLIGFSHTFPGDVDVLLVAPGNTRGVVIMSDAGGGTDVSGISLTFDQAAPHVLPDALVTGIFLPSNFGTAFDPMPPPAPVAVSGHSLTAFNNRPPNGIWRLYIVDDADQDAGSLAGWSLTIRAKLRVPHRHRRRRNQRQRPARRAKR